MARPGESIAVDAETREVFHTKLGELVEQARRKCESGRRSFPPYFEANSYLIEGDAFTSIFDLMSDRLEGNELVISL